MSDNQDNETTNENKETSQDNVKNEKKVEKKESDNHNNSENKNVVSENRKTTDEFSQEYVKEIREEAKRNRIKAKELEDKLSLTQKQLDDIAKDSSNKNSKVEFLEKSLINEKIQKVMQGEGLIDPDALKMVDMSKVTLTENGGIQGLDEIVKELKEKKSYLFKSASNTNKNAKEAPTADHESSKRPVYETNAAFEKAKAEFNRSAKKQTMPIESRRLGVNAN